MHKILKVGLSVKPIPKGMKPQRVIIYLNELFQETASGFPSPGGGLQSQSPDASLGLDASDLLQILTLAGLGE